MSDHGAGMTQAPQSLPPVAKSGGLYVFAAALLASIGAGAAGLISVFGHGLIAPPANTFIAVGLAYAVIPGVPALLAIRRMLRKSQAGTVRDLANYVSLSAFATLLWFLPFVGLYVPYDRTNAAAAVGEMAGYHALAGAIGGLAFWLLTRKQRLGSRRNG